jgi:hypothetical protein
MKKIKKKKDQDFEAVPFEFNPDTFNFNEIVAVTTIFDIPNHCVMHTTHGELILPMLYENAIMLWLERATNFPCDAALEINEGEYKGLANALLLDSNSLH